MKKRFVYCKEIYVDEESASPNLAVLSHFFEREKVYELEEKDGKYYLFPHKNGRYAVVSFDKLSAGGEDMTAHWEFVEIDEKNFFDFDIKKEDISFMEIRRDSKESAREFFDKEFKLSNPTGNPFDDRLSGPINTMSDVADYISEVLKRAEKEKEHKEYIDIHSIFGNDSSFVFNMALCLKDYVESGFSDFQSLIDLQYLLANEMLMTLKEENNGDSSETK